MSRPAILGDPEGTTAPKGAAASALDEKPPAPVTDDTSSDTKTTSSGPPLVDEPKRAAATGNTFHVSGLWRRLAAGAVDLAILTPIWLVLSLVVGAVTGLSLPAARHRGLDYWLDLLLGADPAFLGYVGLFVALGLFYALLFQATGARTPGMRLLGVRVIDLYGDPPSPVRAAVRCGGYLACLATLGLGYLWVGFDSEKRGLHDWLSGTYVVKEGT